jgi:uncharacterized SAM-binding protein YcdF (DUF218 family)
MFFWASKIFGVVIKPTNILLIVLCVGAALLWTRWRRGARWIITVTALIALALAILPVATWPIVALENRFQGSPTLPEKVDGIISLGGIVNQFISKARGQTSVGPGAERLTEFAALAGRYPSAKLVFTGGSGSLFKQELKEADFLRPFLDKLGLSGREVIFEDQSRNTFENALFSKRLVKPAPGEVWVLITSAIHIPRAVGVFRQAGWNVIAYPVSFATEGLYQTDLRFSLGLGMGHTSIWLHEWVGLVAYWLTGRSDSLFPGPDG